MTIAAIPVTIVILLLAAFITRKENKPGMVVIIVCDVSSFSGSFD